MPTVFKNRREAIHIANHFTRHTEEQHEAKRLDPESPASGWLVQNIVTEEWVTPENKEILEAAFRF